MTSINRLALLKEYLREEPGDAFTLYAIALEYIKLNDDAEALKIFLLLKEKHPDYLPMYYHFGKLYERLQEKEKAIETYQEGIKLAQVKKNNHTLNELNAACEDLE